MTIQAKQLPTITIMVSTYNWPQALKPCIKSILNQNYLPNEIVVADDGSDHQTKELIEQLRLESPIPIVHVWHEDDGFRLSEIRNKAILQAKGEYIIQIDGDILLDTHFIADHLSLMENKAFLCGSRVWISKEQSMELLAHTENIKIAKHRFPISSIFNSIRHLGISKFLADRYKKNQPTVLRGCNMSFWKEDLLAVNGYDESIKGWGSEDAELAIRLINHGIK
ncbi:MAG: glycosyltransferase family 2 protein, partial [Sphingobacterium sp.]